MNIAGVATIRPQIREAPSISPFPNSPSPVAPPVNRQPERGELASHEHPRTWSPPYRESRSLFPHGGAERWRPMAQDSPELQLPLAALIVTLENFPIGIFA